MTYRELDVVKTKDGREGTILLIYGDPVEAYEIEYAGGKGDTHTIPVDDVEELVRRMPCGT
ncbi:hypothetical protein ACFSCX_05045 [Bacillus salitolerans]|uniref:DUF4926 domain-containing protein n=1 Tax=Bacillus salitolerans TaxID=1437434 RepID=A0ABW4LN43_9BACI